MKKGWTEDEREIAWRYGDNPGPCLLCGRWQTTLTRGRRGGRRIDWYRVAALTLVILSAAAAAAALIVGVGLVLTAF